MLVPCSVHPVLYVRGTILGPTVRKRVAEGKQQQREHAVPTRPTYRCHRLSRTTLLSAGASIATYGKSKFG